jgi:hypothetical protein
MWSEHAASSTAPSEIDVAFRRRECHQVCLNGTLRALNYMLAAAGVLMMSWDFFAYVEWAQQVDGGMLPAAAQAHDVHSIYASHLGMEEGAELDDTIPLTYLELARANGDPDATQHRAHPVNRQLARIDKTGYARVHVSPPITLQ